MVGCHISLRKIISEDRGFVHGATEGCVGMGCTLPRYAREEGVLTEETTLQLVLLINQSPVSPLQLLYLDLEEEEEEENEKRRGG